MSSELCLRLDCMNTRAHLVQVNQKYENQNDWNHHLKDQLAKSDAALAAAAGQLRAVMEANENLRKQLSDQTHELGVWQGKAEMWQQRAEIAEAQLTKEADRE